MSTKFEVTWQTKREGQMIPTVSRRAFDNDTEALALCNHIKTLPDVQELRVDRYSKEMMWEWRKQS